MADNLGYDGGLTCALQCSDLERSIAWYRDVLGFELLYRIHEMGWCELKSPVAGVSVGLSREEAPQARGGVTLTWGVKEIDAARATLESRGVRFDGETVTIPGMVHLATFYDPDGNRQMFYQDIQGK